MCTGSVRARRNWIPPVPPHPRPLSQGASVSTHRERAPNSRSQAPLGNASPEAPLRSFCGSLLGIFADERVEAELRKPRSQAELGNEYLGCVDTDARGERGEMEPHRPRRARPTLYIRTPPWLSLPSSNC